MANKITLTGLEIALMDWGIGAAAGSKVAQEVEPILNPLVQAVANGDDIKTALITTAINTVETLPAGTDTALSAIVVSVLAEVEQGKSLKEALLDAATALV